MISMFKNSVMAFVLMFSSMGAFAGINGVDVRLVFMPASAAPSAATVGPGRSRQL